MGVQDDFVELGKATGLMAFTVVTLLFLAQDTSYFDMIKILIFFTVMYFIFRKYFRDKDIDSELSAFVMFVSLGIASSALIMLLIKGHQYLVSYVN